jgi:outer membrane protein assembly factor BamA
MARHGALRVGLGALLAVVGAAPAAAQGVGQTEVRNVRFVGNASFPSDSLARAIVTRQTECRSAVFAPFCWLGADFAIQRAYLSRRELPLDQLRLRVWYQRRGYREAAVDTATATNSDGSVDVTFRIQEGAPVLVDSIAFEGVDAFRGEGLLENLPIRKGYRLSTISLDAARDTLISRFANRGYARVDVLRSFFIPSADPHRARVTYDVAPGPRSRYGHISVEGNQDLSESTVLRTIQFRAGDLYRVNQLQEAQARLFGLEIIRSASVTPDFDTGPDSIIPVAVQIREGQPHRVRSGAGWSSSECLDVDSRWVSRNFMGGGRRLQIRGRVSNILAQNYKPLLCWQSGQGPFGQLNWIASADFTQPWIFSTRNSFQASLYGERQSLPGVFVRKAVGLSLSLTRSVGPRTPLTLSYHPELSRLDAAEVLFCTNFLVCRPQDIGILAGANWLAPIGLSFTRNVSNNVLNPSRGYALSLDVEQASKLTGSNFTYTRVQGELDRYVRINSSAVLAARVRAGWVHAGSFEGLTNQDANADIVHPQKRFYAGGANSVRGYPQSRLGPRVLTTDVKNLLRPDTAQAGGAGCTPESIMDLSCDANAGNLTDGAFQSRPTGGTRVAEGNLEFRFALTSSFQGALFTDFGQVWDARTPITLSSVRVTPGLGIRYLSPIGPLRVDLAYRTAGGERLAVVTNQVRPWVEGQDDPSDRIVIGGDPIPYVETQTLGILTPRRLFEDVSPSSIRRWQIHISIGQAF